MPKKPRKESDDVVRVVSHARNDAVGGGCGGRRVRGDVQMTSALRGRGGYSKAVVREVAGKYY